MNVIWRFKLDAPINEVSLAQVPHVAGKVLGAEHYAGAFYVWIVVDPDGKLAPMPFLVARTGAPRVDDLLASSVHVASVGGGFHVFQCPPGTPGYVAPAPAEVPEGEPQLSDPAHPEPN